MHNLFAKVVTFDTHRRRGVLDAALMDKGCQRLATGLQFHPGTLISSTNKLTAISTI